MTSVGVMASSVVTGAACTDVLQEPFNNFTSWTTANTPTIVAGGRTGNGAQFVGAITRKTATFTIPAVNEADTVTMGFAWKATTLAAATTDVALVLSDAGATAHDRLDVTNAGNITVSCGGILLGSAAHGMTAGTFYYLEWQVKLNAAAGTTIVRINGVDKINLTGVNTVNGGTKTVFDRVRVTSGPAGVTTTFDDLYISMGGCTFQGDHTVP